MVKYLKVKKNTRLYKTGDVPDKLYLILNGQISLTVANNHFQPEADRTFLTAGPTTQS